MENKKTVKTAPIQFSYCIGRPWHPKDPNSSVSVYSYGSAVFYGTEADSKKMKEFIESRDKPNKYNVYKLVKA